MSDRENNTYRKIVVGYDGTDQALDALAFAGALSAGTGAKVVAGCIIELQSVGWPIENNWLHVPRERAEEIVRGAADSGMVAADRLETPVGVATSAARGLQALAEDTQADLIVVGSAHRSRAGQALAGSVGHRLLHGAPCAVAVATAGLAAREANAIRQIVVGFDGSAESLHALDAAIGLAEATGARIRLAVVAEPPAAAHGKGGGERAGVAELEEVIESYMEEQLTIGLSYATGGLPIEGSVLRGDPAERLREAAADADVLMVGSRGYGPVRTVLLGSVSAKLMRSAPCAVIVYPRVAGGAPESESLRQTAAADGAL